MFERGRNFREGLKAPLFDFPLSSQTSSGVLAKTGWRGAGGEV